MNKFEQLLCHFSAAVETNNGEELASLFTTCGTYDDGFFGAHSGCAAISAMLQRFHDTGANFRWRFFDVLAGEYLAYARYCFSYESRLVEYEGRPVCFEGISSFRMDGDKIQYYSEIFDKGMALVQIGMPAERIRRVLEKSVEIMRSSGNCAGELTLPPLR